MDKLRSSRTTLEQYIVYRMHRARQAIEWIESTVELNNKNILDIGCGYGNLALAMANEGAEITAVDLDVERIELAKKYNFHENIQYISKDLAELADHSYDLVTLFDVLEHVCSYERILIDVARLVKPGGYIFVEYNPYYSFIGHHLYDYTFFPVQYLPYAITEKIVLSRSGRGGIFSDEYALKQFRELNRITIRGLRSFLKNNGFQICYERNEINYPGGYSISTGFLRHFPYVEDFFTFAHILVLKAPSLAAGI